MPKRPVAGATLTLFFVDNVLLSPRSRRWLSPLTLAFEMPHWGAFDNLAGGVLLVPSYAILTFDVTGGCGHYLGFNRR